MKCIKCKCDMHQGHTTFVTDTRDRYITIQRVPCFRCNACGETAYTGEVAENIEKIVKAARESLIEVAVMKYPEAIT